MERSSFLPEAYSDSDESQELFDYKKTKLAIPSRKLRTFVILFVVSILFIVVIFAVVVSIWKPGYGGYAETTCTSRLCVMNAADVLSQMDPKVDPCQDFHKYACGGSNELPLDASKWSRFSKIARQNKLLMKNLLEAEGSDLVGQGHSDAIRKAKDTYRNCMMQQDDAKISNNTILLRKIAEQIGGSWAPTSASGEATFEPSPETGCRVNFDHGTTALFSMAVLLDQRNTSFYRLTFDQSGLSLPRDYYMPGNRDAFVDYAATVVEVTSALSTNRSYEVARSIWTFERQLSLEFTNKSERYNPDKVYHKMKFKEFKEMFSNFNLERVIKETLDVDIKPEELIIVNAPEYFKRINLLISNTPHRTLADYASWRLLSTYSGFLGRRVVKAAFQLSKFLNGQSASTARWIRCVTRTEGNMPSATGALYVSRRFSGPEKTQLKAILHSIRDDFKRRITSLSWMDQQTKRNALTKVMALQDHVGYPAFIKSPAKLDKHYEKMQVIPGEPLESQILARRFYVDQNRRRFRRRFTKYLWAMSAGEVNAYYTPAHNAIVFPAGILQKNFFSSQYPMSMNYGGIGSVIGHELSHAFDNTGRMYDKSGNLHNWWSPFSDLEFKQQSKCFVDQYNAYTVGDSHVDGRMTLGENIADNGGISASYRSYTAWLKVNRETVELPGLHHLSNDQMFFLSFAQNWCATYTDKMAALSLKIDVHTYSKYRIIGPLSNSKHFAKAFSCPKNSPMNPEKKCTLL